ncbi:hypothetical protein SprV_0602041400 [Sparganum proliferum]
MPTAVSPNASPRFLCIKPPGVQDDRPYHWWSQFRCPPPPSTTAISIILATDSAATTTTTSPTPATGQMTLPTHRQPPLPPSPPLPPAILDIKRTGDEGDAGAWRGRSRPLLRRHIEAWASDENSANRFIDLAPAYRALRSHLQSCVVSR